MCMQLRRHPPHEFFCKIDCLPISSGTVFGRTTLQYIHWQLASIVKNGLSYWNILFRNSSPSIRACLSVSVAPCEKCQQRDAISILTDCNIRSHHIHFMIRAKLHISSYSSQYKVQNKRQTCISNRSVLAPVQIDCQCDHQKWALHIQRGPELHRTEDRYQVSARVFAVSSGESVPPQVKVPNVK